MALSEADHPLPRRATNPLAAFLQGFFLPFAAIGFLLRRRRLWPLVAIPICLNMLLFIAVLVWGWLWFAGRLEGWLGSSEATAWYWKALTTAAKILFWGIVLLAVYFVFTPIALLLAAPFNDQLAERAEKACGFPLPDDGRGFLRSVAGEAVYAVKCEAKRMALFVLVFLALIPLQAVPVLGAALAFAWLCLATLYEFTSYAADRRHLPMSEKWRRIREAGLLAIGFGLATVCLLLVPFLNVLMVPASAVGGTMLFGLMGAGNEKTGRPPKGSPGVW